MIIIFEYPFRVDLLFEGLSHLLIQNIYILATYHFVLVQSFPFNLDIQTINQIKDFISREVYLLHQIVCSRKVLRWNLMIRKLKKSWNTRRLLTLPQIFVTSTLHQVHNTTLEAIIYLSKLASK